MGPNLCCYGIQAHSEGSYGRHEPFCQRPLTLSTQVLTHEVYHQSVWVRSMTPQSLEPPSTIHPQRLSLQCLTIAKLALRIGHEVSVLGLFCPSGTGCYARHPSMMMLPVPSPQTAEEAAVANLALTYLFSRAGNRLGQLRDSFKVFQLLIERLASEPNFSL